MRKELCVTFARLDTMISQIVVVVLLAITTVAVEGASVALENDFIEGAGHIFGPVSYRFKDEKTGRVDLRQSYYLATTACNMCKLVFGDDNAHSLYLETYEELQELEKYLEPGFAEPFWTGGEWNSSEGAFQWENGVPFGDVWNNTWEAGYPGLPTPLTKVLLTTRGTHYQFRTDTEEKFYPCLCELEYNETCILDSSDLVVVLDGSGSVGQIDFDIAKQFIAKLADVWLENGQNRISLIVFSTFTTTEFSLDNGLSASYPGGGEFTHLGLEAALEELRRNNRTVPQYILLLTDGPSSDPNQTLVNAKMLLDAGVEAFAIGVGRSNRDELLAVVGNNEEHVFTTEGLVDVLESLQEVLCKN